MTSKGITGFIIIFAFLTVFGLGYFIYMQRQGRCLCDCLQKRAEYQKNLAEMHDIQQQIADLEANMRAKKRREGEVEEAKAEVEMTENSTVG